MPEDKISDLLSLIHNAGEFTLLEKLLLAQGGTVQSLLSVIFGSPIGVSVQSQHNMPNGLIFRGVNLVKESLIVLSADSTLALNQNSKQVIQLVEEKHLGLGQIALTLGIPTTRQILTIGRTEDTFYRTYRMRGTGLNYCITEKFPTSLYRSRSVLGPGGG